MSLENITRKIVSEAKEFAEATIAEAQEEAKTIAKEYETAADKEYNQIVDAAYEKASEIHHRSNAQVMKEKRVNTLSAKWGLLDNAFASAVRMLSRQPDDKQVSLLTSLVGKYQRTDAELIFNKNDRGRIGQTVVDAVGKLPGGFKTTLSEKTGDFAGGLVIKESDVEANLTYEVLVASKREQLEEEVLTLLFGIEEEED